MSLSLSVPSSFETSGTVFKGVVGMFLFLQTLSIDTFRLFVLTKSPLDLGSFDYAHEFAHPYFQSD